MGVTDTETEVDGRRLRREQNREAVLDALVELFREGHFLASTAEIAERAGLSPRSLFRYFDDVDDLNRAAIERMQANARPLLELHTAPDAPLAERIAAIVDARIALYERVQPGARAARIMRVRHELVAAQLTQGRVRLREQIRRLFPAEIDAAPDVLPVLDVLLSFEANDLLRTDQALTKTKVRAALIGALTALLAPTKGTR